MLRGKSRPVSQTGGVRVGWPRLGGAGVRYVALLLLLTPLLGGVGILVEREPSPSQQVVTQIVEVPRPVYVEVPVQTVVVITITPTPSPEAVPTSVAGLEPVLVSNSDETQSGEAGVAASDTGLRRPVRGAGELALSEPASLSDALLRESQEETTTPEPLTSVPTTQVESAATPAPDGASSSAPLAIAMIPIRGSVPQPPAEPQTEHEPTPVDHENQRDDDDDKDDRGGTASAAISGGPTDRSGAKANSDEDEDSLKSASLDEKSDDDSKKTNRKKKKKDSSKR